MYEPAPGMVNGDIIADLTRLCNEWFSHPFVMRYAGANEECMFCGVIKRRGNDAIHKKDCPAVKYSEVGESHRYLIEVF